MVEFVRMTAAEFRRAIGAGPAATKDNKYKAKTVVYHHEKYDSKKECARHRILMEMQLKGLVSNVKRQVTFMLQEGFDYRGAKIRPITYIADFTYHDNQTNTDVVEDVKSKMTAKLEVYRIKIKLFKKRYPEYEFREYK